MTKSLDAALGAVSEIGKLEVVKVEHTPTPWTIGEFQENSFINQRPINPAIGAVYGDKNETLVNAAFIVRSCNAHDALVEALDCCAKNLRHITQQSDEVRKNGKPRSHEAEYLYTMCVNAALKAEAVLKLARGEK